MLTQRDFLGYLQALGPLIAASVAVGVASMQYYLQRQQMKQQLFHQRYEIYLEVRTFLSRSIKVHDRQPLDNEAYNRFQAQMRPAKFLFGSDVTEYLLRLYRDIAHEEDANGNMILRVGWEDDDDDSNIQLKWAVGAERAFRPYLQLHHDRSLLVRLFARINRWVDLDQPARLASRYDV